MTILQKVARAAAVKPGDATSDLGRLVHGTSALAYLMQRGVDGPALLAHGVGSSIAAALDAFIAVSQVEKDVDWSAWPHLHRWLELRSSCDGGGEVPGLSLSPSFRRHVVAWIAASEPHDVFTWTPPTALPDLPEPNEDEAAEYGWFVTRMTQTYLSDWAANDLKLEYRFVSGQWRPDFLPLPLVRERSEGRATVTEAIAAKQLEPLTPDVETVAALTEQAVDFINRGERDKAATIFSAARAVDSANPHWTNNYAFCVLPDDPAAALDNLRETIRLGRDDVVVRCNLALAHYLLKDSHDALEVLEAAYQPAANPLTAYLWVRTADGELEMQLTNAWVYLVDLGLQVARELNHPSIDAWGSRRDALAN